MAMAPPDTPKACSTPSASRSSASADASDTRAAGAAFKATHRDRPPRVARGEVVEGLRLFLRLAAHQGAEACQPGQHQRHCFGLGHRGDHGGVQRAHCRGIAARVQGGVVFLVVAEGQIPGDVAAVAQHPGRVEMRAGGRTAVDARAGSMADTEIVGERGRRQRIHGELGRRGGEVADDPGAVVQHVGDQPDAVAAGIEDLAAVEDRHRDTGVRVGRGSVDVVRRAADLDRRR